MTEKSRKKEDNDISIGNIAYEIAQKLQYEEYKKIMRRKYFVKTCSRIVEKFPLNEEHLKNADVVCLENIEIQSLKKIK